MSDLTGRKLKKRKKLVKNDEDDEGQTEQDVESEVSETEESSSTDEEAPKFTEKELAKMSKKLMKQGFQITPDFLGKGIMSQNKNCAFAF